MFGMLTRSRAFSVDALKVYNNVAKQQFTVSVGNADAVIDYERKNNNKIIFHETHVPEEFKGKGVGKLLAKYAFDHAMKSQLDVEVKCHFLANYYNRNIDKYKGLRVTIDIEEQ